MGVGKDVIGDQIDEGDHSPCRERPDDLDVLDLADRWCW